MKVKCPKCGFEGNTSDNLIPDNGRNISCPKCKESFFIRKQTIPIPEKEVPQQSNFPAPLKEINSPRITSPTIQTERRIPAISKPLIAGLLLIAVIVGFICGYFAHTIIQNKKSVELAKNYSQRGGDYDKDKDYVRAIEFISIAICLDPNNDEYYARRGGVYADLLKYDEALEDCNKAISLNPNGIRNYLNRSYVYGEMNKDKEVIEDCNAGLALITKETEKKDITGLYVNRGRSYANLGLYEKGIEDNTAAIELSPNEGGAYKNRAIDYYKLGKIEETLSDLKKACELGLDDACEGYKQLLDESLSQ